MSMPDGTHRLGPAVRKAVRSTYVVAGMIWLGALAFAGYRLHQMRTLTPLEAEVLKADVESYAIAGRDTDSDGFTTQTQTEGYVPVVLVRYGFNNRIYTVAARHDTGGLKWVQDRIARRWKPGARIRIHMDPGEPEKPLPDLGWNLPTFQLSFVLLAAGCLFALFGYGLGRAAAFASSVFEHAIQRPVGAAEEDEPLPVPVGTAKASAGVVCCVTSPLFDPLGYVLTVAGLVLLWRASGIPAGVRLLAAAVVLPPRIAPLLLSALAGPGEFSFALHPDVPATSPGAWGWYGLLWAVGALLITISSEKGNAFLARAGLRQAAARGTRHERTPILLIIPVLLVLAWATHAVLGLKNEFEWVEAAETGAWELKHSVRGTVATFTAETVASIEGREETAGDPPTYHIRFTLESGDARVLRTPWAAAFGEMKKLAATMELPPGRMQLQPVSGDRWTNGPYRLKDRTGTYEAANGNVVELRLDQRGRLTGTETVRGRRGEKIIRPLRAVKVTEDGGLEYRTGIFTSSTGRFEEDGMVLDGMKLRKSGK